MKKLTYYLMLMILAISATNAQNAGKTALERFKMEQMQNPTADVQPGIPAGVNQTNGNHYSKYVSSDATRGILFDNGPLVTAEGVGSNGSDYSELQDASLGMGTYGSGFQVSAGASIADDFEVIGNWNISSFTFFAYQTGTAPPSTLNDVRVQVYDEDPSAGGTVVWGNLTTNIMLSTEWTNAWRVLESGPTENRPIMNIVADASGLSLAAGTYWVEVSVGGTGASGPWAPAVTIVGETTTGNALQQTSTGWAALVDGGTLTPQGLPFIVEGLAGNQPANDMGIVAIVAPVSGYELGDAEPVTFTMKNYGTDSQSNIPYEVIWDGPLGAQTINGNYTGPVAAGETVQVEAGTADLSEFGEYSFEVCSMLDGDEYADNDCKSSIVVVDYDLSPPTNFTAEFIEGVGVNCNWNPPDPPNSNGEWIGYDDGVNYDGLGLVGGGTFWGAIRWEPNALSEYDGWLLTEFEFVPRFFANGADFTFMIWEGANAANLVYQQSISNLSWNEWNTIELDIVHLIDASTELWIGIKVVHVDSEYPFGIGDGPAIAGYDDMISFDANDWESMGNTYGINNNFNLKGFVTNVAKGKTGNKKVIAQSKIHPITGPVRGKLKAIEYPDFHKYPKGLVGYNVYRDGVKINPEPLTGLSFTDAFFEPGVYTYYAKAVYVDGLSEASNQFEITITGPEPEITVYPTSLNETHDNPPELTTKILTLTNSGDATLIFEVATSTLLFTKSSLPEIDPQEYSRKIETRHVIEGQPSADVQTGVIPGLPQTNGNHFSKYQGPNGTRNVLYDNGPLVTAEGVGSNGSDYSELQDASLGMGTYGAGFQVSAGNSLADEFVVTGNWDISSFTFFGYQTGSGPPSTLNDVRVQIYDASPMAGGNVIWGDFSTNVMVSTEWTNAWRVLESGPTENRPIMNIVADASGLSLSTGTYWVEYSVGGTGASGPWCPAVTIVGETTTGNALQQRSTGWAALVDGGTLTPQGVPFMINGSTGYSGSDWYSVFPTSGIINPGEYTSLDVTFDSEGLQGGTYVDILSILSNDPDEPVVGVTLTLFVAETQPVIADFFANPLLGTAPLQLSFTDLSSGDVLQWEWDFDNDGVIDSYNSNPSFTYTQSGVYSVELTVLDGEGGSASELKENYITVLSPEAYFTTVWTSPYNPMTFYILEATIDDFAMQAGDEVGLFDIDPNTGDEICVGAGTLVEPLGGSVFLEIIASMDDGSNPEQANGFTLGNNIIYKLWNEAEGEITSLTTVYPYPGYDEVYTSQGSAFVELYGVTAITQCVGLTTGWNILSYRAMPENPDMLSVLQPIINEDILYKVLDEAGGSVFHLPFPPPNGQWSNTIGNLQATEGYYVKVTESGEICVTGHPMETPLEIQLTAGWNIISYPCEFEQNALDALQPLIDQDVLYKVIDEAGGTVFHLPFPPPNGQWSNTIGNFKSGEGYYVKVTANATLTIECPSAPIDLMTFIPEIIEPIYFVPAYENNPYMPMHIVLNPSEGLQSGDEIAVFNGNICVGAAVVTGNPESPIIIKASQNDPDAEIPNGFNTGDQIQLMVWNNTTGQVSEVEYEYLEGSQTFAPLETMFGELKALVTDDDSNFGIFQPKVIPNPFAQKTNVMLFLKESSTLSIRIQNLNGATVFEMAEQNFDEGQQNIEITLQKLESGVYFLMIDIESENNAESFLQKLIKL